MITFVAAVATCFFIFKTSRRYFSAHASLFAVLGFLGFNYVFRHLTAFRTDILVTMCLMAVLWIVSDPEQTKRNAVIAGLLIGIAFTLALKSIFFMPIVAVFLLGRWKDSHWSKQAFTHGLIMFSVSVVCYVLLFVLHDPATFGSGENRAYLQSISESSFLGGRLFNNWGFLVISFIFNFYCWGFLIFGFAATLRQIKNTDVRPTTETIGLLLFIIPLTPVIYYFHANPYFFPFMLAPAVIFIAAALDSVLKHAKTSTVIMLICIFGLFPVLSFVRSLPQNQNAQRLVVDAVHEIFPSPVSVVDYCGMISSFDRLNESGLFINPDIFAHSKYLKAGKPMMSEFVKTYQPKVFLTNVIRLQEVEGMEKMFFSELLDEDVQFFKENYTNFWGPVYVPGKTLAKDGGFEIFVDGTYTYYGAKNANIDGAQVANGDVLDLSQGVHQVSGISTHHGQLVWGDKLKKPDSPAPSKPLFNGF